MKRAKHAVSFLTKSSYLYIFTCVLLAILFLFLRFYKLSDVPFGLHVDEVAMGYDAFSLSQYGVARDLTPWPVYLTNFGGGQNVLSVYLTAAFTKILGPGTITIRLAGILFSAVTVVCGTLLVKERFGKKVALLGATFLVIMPYFINQSRFGLESYLLTGASTAAIHFVILAVKRQKLGWFALAGFLLGLSLYTYAISYAVSCLFVLGLVIYLLYTRKVTWRQLVVMGTVLFVIAFPLIAFVVINHFSLPEFQLGFLTIPRIPGYRGQEIGLGRFIVNIRQVFENALFTDIIPYNSFEKHYTLYLVSVPFALLGFAQSIWTLRNSLRKRTYDVTVIVFMYTVATMFVGLFLLDSGPNINKMNGMFFGWCYMTVTGILFVAGRAQYKKVFAAVLGAAYLISFIAFFRFYYFAYPVEHYPQFLFFPELETTIPVVEELREDRPVYYTTEYSSVYYAYATQSSPDTLHFVNGQAKKVGDTVFFERDIGAPQQGNLYVVWECDHGLIREMEEAGLARLHEGRYLIFG